MELRFCAQTEEEMDYVESAVFVFFNLVGITPEDLYESRVEEKEDGTFELLVVFREDRMISEKLREFAYHLSHPVEKKRRGKCVYIRHASFLLH